MADLDQKKPQISYMLLMTANKVDRNQGDGRESFQLQRTGVHHQKQIKIPPATKSSVFNLCNKFRKIFPLIYRGI